MSQIPPRNSRVPQIDEAAIERAESALRGMADKFDHWIEEETEHLLNARDALRSRGLSPETIEVLSHKAHDLKGQGTTLNFPFVTRIAESLCRLCEHLPAPQDLPLSLVDAHVDALRAIVRDGVKGAENATGIAVSQELRARVDDALTTWRTRAGGAN